MSHQGGGHRSGPDPDLLAEVRRIGDRLGAWSALLPAAPSGVLLLVDEPLATTLCLRFPGAVSLPPGSETTAVGTGFGLIVVDARRHPTEGLSSLLGADGALAVLGREGPFLVYPRAELPEHVWRRGWPLPASHGLAAHVRRVVGIRTARLRSVSRLGITSPAAPSLADLVARDVGASVGERLELIGVVTAGHTILRLRGRLDLAVSFSFVDPAGTHLAQGEDVVRDVPTLSRWTVPVVARGETLGFSWVAVPWVTRSPLTSSRRRDEIDEGTAVAVCNVLAERPTGRTAPGWAATWCQGVSLLDARDLARCEEALLLLEGGLPTGWCHGDLWAGNILGDGDGVTVIDWDTASRVAPLGLDRVICTAHRLRASGTGGMGEAVRRLVDEPGVVRGEVAGVAWESWDRRHRAALGLAAHLRHLSNRSLRDLGQQQLDVELRTVRALADTVLTGTAPADGVAHPAPPGPSDQDADADALARRSARGVAWLGASALVVKASQTLVLLTLAAVLTPSALGVVALGTLVVNVTSSLTDLGSSTALVYWRGDAERAARTALSLTLALCLLVTTIGWFVAPPFSEALHGGPDGASVVRGLLLTVPLLGIAGVSRELMRRDLLFVRRILPDVLSTLAGTGLALALALHGYGVMSLVVGQLTQAAAAVVVCWLVRRPVWPGWNTAHARGLVAYGHGLAGATLIQLVLLNVDYLVVARVLGAGALGEYSLAFRLAYMPFLLVTVVVCGATFPRLCRLRGAAVGEAAGRVLVLTLIVSLPLHLGLFLLAPEVQLLGPEWAAAVPPLRWLAAYGLLLSVVQLCQTPLNAVARTRDTLALKALHLALLTGALLVVTSRGTTSVSIAQTAVVAVVAAAAVAVALRRVPGLDGPPLAHDVLPALGGGVAMTAVVLATQHLGVSSPVSFPGLVLNALVGLLTYVLVTRVLGGRHLLDTAHAVLGHKAPSPQT